MEKPKEEERGVWDRGRFHFYSDEEIEEGMKKDKKFLRKILLEY